MKKKVFIFAIVVITAAFYGIVVYRAHLKTPYTMAWDMAAHTYYGAELAQDIRNGHLIAFLDHINTSSIALWPFLHPLMLSLWFIIFGFSDKTAVSMTIVFSSLCLITGFITGFLTTRKKSYLPGLLFIFFIASSPIFIAFSNYVMLEVFGAFFVLLMLILFSLNHETDNRWLRILFSFSFLSVFLTKINYGLYLFIPYLLYEILYLPEDKRKIYKKIFLLFLDWKNPKNVLNILIALNSALIVLMRFMPSYRFSAFGHEIAVSGTKNLVFLLLFIVFLKTVIFYIRQRHFLFENLLPVHIKIIQILIIPIFIWFIINPGRLVEFIRMSADRNTDFELIGIKNILFYAMAFINDYSCHFTAGIAMLLLTTISLIQWKNNPPLIKFLLLLVSFGYIGLTLKLPNFAHARFIFIQAVVIFIISAFEIWRINGKLKEKNKSLQYTFAILLAAGACVLLVFPIRNIYTSKTNDLIRKSAPTVNPRLQFLMDRIVREIRPDEKRLCIVGSSNEMSPFLVKWTVIKIFPEITPLFIEPPLKSINSEEDKIKMENWLKKGEADLIIALEIHNVSPFAQGADFKSFHAEKQKIVRFLREQDIYYLAKEAVWGSKAVGIKLYRKQAN